ncbi:MAG: L-aspartate oxidase [Gammaproteobacteria bacterium]|nr:MAG: L-aspartate oxidase [Gammaproteobacteria bacterium]
MTQRSDVLIIGSGAAGLSLALILAERLRVTVIAKGALREGNTLYAQGGISAVFDSNDSVTSHVEDTLRAGAGLCHREVVEHVASQGRASIEWLASLGVPFTLGEGGFHLTREGGHSHRRVIHAEDATGRAVELTLEEKVRRHPGIMLHEFHVAVDLITGDGEERCIGAYVYDRSGRRVETFLAPVTVLATGGSGKVYLYTSNPDVATGDGIAMAWRAGCRIANMEFFQFHPTCLFHPQAKSFLISEALRGEGAVLRLPDGERFMPRFHEQAELAPRDIVARAIDHEMKRLGIDCVYLDITHRPPEFIRDHFPTIFQRCLEFGFDLTREPIPVVPAAHYQCGGVVTDLTGATSLAGLYAIGEVACTGLHGANRMASNSLLECLVFARGCATDILRRSAELEQPGNPPPWDESRVTDSDEEVVVAHDWDELRRMMWDYVGIVRSDSRLERALRRVEVLSQEVDDYYARFRLTQDLIELRNLVVVAELIIRSAMRRKESRGLHYNVDHPEPDPAWEGVDTVLWRGEAH